MWNDGATPQIISILSPSYVTNSTSGLGSPRPPSSKSKTVRGAVVAGAVIAGVAVLGLAGGALWFFLRRRKQASAEITAADNIALTDVNPDVPSYPGELFPNPHSSPPLLSDKKLYTEDIVPRNMGYYQADRGELGTGGEIHQLPTGDNAEGNYLALASHIQAERRAANTPQIDGRSIVYELPGSEITPSEMDDEWSRQGRSPRMPARTWTSVSSRSTSPYPGGPFL
jgi:hypothetical protein